MAAVKESLLLDVKYSEWATRRLLHACGALEIADQCRDLENSHKSVLGTLHHIYLSERFWSECLLANALPPMRETNPADDPPAPALAQLQEAWTITWNNLSAWYALRTDEDLAHTLLCQMPGGAKIPLTRWLLLRHMVNHATLHRGQVVGMLRAMGKQPPNVDLMSYYLTQA